MTQWPPLPPHKPWSKRKTTTFVGCVLGLYVGLVGLGGVLSFVGARLVAAGNSLKASADHVNAKLHPPPVTAIQPVQNKSSEYLWQLHSDRPFNEVRVPFAYNCGHVHVSTDTPMILVKANLAGKTSLCVIDTGASGISWPQSLKLPGQHRAGGTLVGINNSQRPTEIVTLPSVHVGNYEMTSLPTFMIERNAKEQGMGDFFPNIGNYALWHTVMTVDYQNRAILFRSPDYDVTLLPRASQDMLLDFEWVGGCPGVRGTIEGQPTKLLIDTGFQAKFAVEKHFFNAHLRDRVLAKHGTGGAFGNMQEACLDKAQCSIGGVNIEDKQVGVTDLGGAWDGIIGQHSLALYDVTIDYPRQKLLLHRNALRDTQMFSDKMTMTLH